VGGAWKFGEGVRIRTTEAEVVIRALRQGLDIAQDIAERPEWEDKFNEWLAGRGQLPAGTIAGLRRLASIRARDAGREATGGANEL
jgi:hypothetical protein